MAFSPERGAVVHPDRHAVRHRPFLRTAGVWLLALASRGSPGLRPSPLVDTPEADHLARPPLRAGAGYRDSGVALSRTLQPACNLLHTSAVVATCKHQARTLR